MKIETGYAKQVIPAFDHLQKQSRRTPETARPESGDFSVHLSEKLEEAAPLPETDEEIRWEKVAAIRRQLAEGQYNISGKDVADRMLEVLKG